MMCMGALALGLAGCGGGGSGSNPLQLTMFASITAEATSAAGATVTVPAPTVSDASATVTCTPNVGSATYPLGTTPVNCSATDAAGEVATGSSFVRVIDTTAPSLAMFAPITAAATSASGAVVNVPAPTAADATGAPTVSCTPSPGLGTYPVGTTTVACTATDASGNATSATSTVTVTAAAPTSAFRAISAGLEVTCALATDGTPYCWGNAATLLGLTPAPTTPQLTPQPVQTALKFTTISVSGYINQGDQTACALTADGSAFCWGKNGSGAIGDGTTTNRVSPTPVSGGHHFVTISTRVGTTCAIDNLGAGWCWGGNVNTALGNGDINGATQLVPVPMQTTAHLVQLSMGFEGGCAVTSTAQVLCWGDNTQGQLGRGSLVPFFGITPQPVIGLGAMASVHAADSQVCALSTTGAAFCWGASSHGALGDGTATGNATTTPVAVAGGRSFAGLTGGFLATCGWTLGLPGAGGSSACWGFNLFGQLGDGTRTDRFTPTPVASALSFSVITQSVANVALHACALTASGQAYCWGNNSSGQLGDGSTVAHLAPGPVTMP